MLISDLIRQKAHIRSEQWLAQHTYSRKIQRSVLLFIFDTHSGFIGRPILAHASRINLSHLFACNVTYCISYHIDRNPAGSVPVHLEAEELAKPVLRPEQG